MLWNKKKSSDETVPAPPTRKKYVARICVYPYEGNHNHNKSQTQFNS